MPLQQTSGNVTQDAYGGGIPFVPTYVENVFSTYLYSGTGATQSITNNIDLTDNGGMVWIKDRTNAYNNNLFDTAQGATKLIKSNTSAATATDSNSLTSFNTTGFTLGSGNTSGNQVNTSSNNFVSWTFRKQPKFFDIVTYTGNGSYQTINHNLGSVPGCIIVKRTDISGAWNIYHIGLGGGSSASGLYLLLSNIAGVQSNNNYFPSDPTSTNFTVGPTNDQNASGGTFVAYIFSIGGTGGFGLTGTQDIIKCDSFTTNSSGNATISLGWEPQYFLYKRYSGSSFWYVFDEMRGFNNTFTQALYPNSTGSEGNISPPTEIPTATGINVIGDTASSSYIYIAIRRGPMATPTTGTSVFSPNVVSVSGSADTVTTNFVVDLSASSDNINSGTNKANFIDRLRGSSQTSNVYLTTSQTNSETSNSHGMTFDNNTGYVDYFNVNTISSSSTFSYWNFARAPGFFDEVVYTATNATTTLPHNLTVAPEMMIVKDRSAGSWYVYHKSLHGGVNPQQYYLALNVTNAQNATANTTVWGNTAPTSTQFTVGNLFGSTTDSIVTYLFATCAGVSYVGSYTGNGGTQAISCGFGAGGARFILAKATSTTGNWYVFDSANGLTSSSSPYLLWNSTAAQTTGNNGVYASSGGFTLTSSSPVNTSGGTFIFLAIA